MENNKALVEVLELENSKVEEVDLEKDAEELELLRCELNRQKEELKDEWDRLREQRESFREEKKQFLINSQTVAEDLKKVKEERSRIAIEKADLERRVALEKERSKREKDLFDMKWKLLESELANLAKEREEFEKMGYHQTDNANFDKSFFEDDSIEITFLFRGVTNELALKKRYKDLIKIYHPDNVAGDKEAVQEITAEYERLKEEFRSRY